MAVIDAFRPVIGNSRHLVVKSTANGMLKNVKDWFASDPTLIDKQLPKAPAATSTILNPTHFLASSRGIGGKSPGRNKLFSLVEVAYESVATMLTPTSENNTMDKASAQNEDKRTGVSALSSSSIASSIANASERNVDISSSSSVSAETGEVELEYKIMPGYMELDPLEQAKKGFRFENSKRKAKELGSMFGLGLSASPDKIWYIANDYDP